MHYAAYFQSFNICMMLNRKFSISSFGQAPFNKMRRENHLRWFDQMKGRSIHVLLSV